MVRWCWSMAGTVSGLLRAYDFWEQGRQPRKEGRSTESGLLRDGGDRLAEGRWNRH
jgi:hypothetical protein